MSLIGSLEDLGLGDILQIISLSQKSGVLVIRSEDGEGRIVFLDGLVRGACVKGGPSDLRSVLVTGGFLSEDQFDAAEREARQQGRDLETVIAEQTPVPAERIDSLRRETVEQAVMRIFSWRVGEFSFDVREEPEPEDPPLFVPTGINAQYLAMECSRLGDEQSRAPAADLEGDDEDDEDLSAEEMFGVTPDPDPEEAPIPAEPPAQPAAEAPVEAVPAEPAEPGAEAELVEAELIEDDEAQEAGPAVAEEPAAAPPPRVPLPPGAPPVVVLDGDLPALEWTKEALSELFAQVHIFQRCDLALARIRQYLARGRTPLVLVSPAAAADPLSGIPDAADFARRLKTQASRMRVLWLCEDGAEAPDRDAPTDGRVVRPASHQLRNPTSWKQLEASAERLRGELTRRLTAPRGGEEGGGARDVSPRALSQLKGATAALREASSRGEVLPLVIRFAAESFARVAMFVVRDGEVMGMAGAGLERAGGPDDTRLRDVRLRADEAAWLRVAIEGRASLRAAPSDEGDRSLARQLGDRLPDEAYLAPVESAGHVVALLYADNLPEGQSLPDTSALEVVLHHAGLALDRAALERALAEAEGENASGDAGGVRDGGGSAPAASRNAHGDR